MKQLTVALRKLSLTAFSLFVYTLSFAQTPLDTVKPGRANDPMVVNPGKANDGMAVKPEKPNDGMSVLSDTAFLNKNIMDNMMEIRLSKLGQEKGTTPEVKKVAALMITDHTALLHELEKLASANQGNAKADHKEMAMTKANFPEGKDFDAAWAGQMLAMHEAKIAELESFLGLTKNAALKSAVIKAIPKIKTHRDMLLKIPGAKEKSKSSHTI
jgi:predicted outer membrane protein